jgi:ribosomal protein S18 acetylase RimI-like enzyme
MVILGLMSDLRTRPLRFADDGSPDPGDVATAVRLVQECDLAVLGEQDSGDADAASLFALPELDRESSVLVLDGDDVVAVTWIENDVNGRDTFVDVFAPPGRRAREAQDLGLEIGLEAARRHRTAAPVVGEWTARAGAWVADVDYAAALVAHGFEPKRTFYRMRVESTAPEVPLEMPPLPVGVELVVSDEEETRRRIHAISDDSFAEHYNHTPRGYDEWWAHFSAGTTHDPDGWWLLTVDGVDAAVCLLDESRAEIGDGYVAVLGVRKEFRGRGLAQLLLRRSFVRYRDMGRSGTQLGVDAENGTGAVRVYESVGMQVTRAVLGYAQPVA